MVLWAGAVLISTEQLHMPLGVLIKTHTENELCSARWWRGGYSKPILNRGGPQRSGGEYRSLPYRHTQHRQTQASRQLPESRPGHWALSVRWPVKGTSLHLPCLIIEASQVDRIALLKISVPCGSVCVCVCVCVWWGYFYIILMYSHSFFLLYIRSHLNNGLFHTSQPSRFFSHPAI